jgi:predicted transcriptional regulator
VDVARASWFDETAEHLVVHEQVTKLESFTSALADGVVTKQELGKQEAQLVAALKTLEPQLNDAQHDQVTRVLVEMSAYNVMRLLHELQTERARMAFQGA